MRKFIWILILIIFLLGNYLSFITLETSLTAKTLYGNVSQVEIKNEVNYDQKELIHSIDTFSKKCNLNIMQYTFVGEQAINIYASNIKDSNTFHTSNKGKSPTKAYLSNDSELHFPTKKWDIKIYSFDQVNNVSLGSVFYVEGLDNKLNYEAFIKEFEQYGDLAFENLNFKIIDFIDSSMLSILLLCLYVYWIILFYYMKQEQSLLVKQLWGYSNWDILKPLVFKFSKCIFIALAILAFVVISLFIKGVQFYYISFLSYLIFVNILLFLFITVSVYLFGRHELKKKSVSLSNIKHQTTKQQLIFNLITKFILVFSLTLLFVTFFKNYTALTNEVNNFATWSHAKNVNKVQVGTLLDDNGNDLKKNYAINNKFSNFYEKAKETDDAFVMYSTNFRRLENGEFQYLKMVNDKNDILSPNGKSITIDLNYLHLNPIKAIDGKDAVTKIIDNDYTLNILIPLKQKTNEAAIVQNYVDWFYFQKIEIANMYREELGLSKLNTSKESLKINCIYVQDEQNYFTYDINSGSQNDSQIKDPLAIIYTNNLDSSYIGSLTTSSMFFTSTHTGQAFNKISPIIEDTGATEITHVFNVYQSISEEIIALKSKLYRQSISVMLILAIMICFSIIFTKAQYQNMLYKQAINHVFGKSFWQSSSALILMNLLVSFISGSLVIWLSSEYVGYAFLIIMLLIECLIIYTIRMKIVNKDIKILLKGEKYD
ncbi:MULTISPECIES: DUF1430 domain-containing protein [unclassified Listeria]|uniref:DUF1430 domain-containing protein n=1 Tax=unclassified Listeria TaxID=2642072 RepID=UPI000B58E496|nr:MULTISPECIES: DUF1430 domain-containing protein [unclassified Listeria]